MSTREVEALQNLAASVYKLHDQFENDKAAASILQSAVMVIERYTSLYQRHQSEHQAVQAILFKPRILSREIEGRK